MPYAIFYYVIMLHVFRSKHHCPWKFHKFHRKTPALESLFFLKMMKLYKGICSAWISRTSAKKFFFMDWHHKHLKNVIDLLLFYEEHFHGFSESDLWKRRKKTFISQHIYLYESQIFQSFMKLYFVHIVKVCFVFKKQSLCLYFSIYA